MRFLKEEEKMLQNNAGKIVDYIKAEFLPHLQKYDCIRSEKWKNGCERNCYLRIRNNEITLYIGSGEYFFYKYGEDVQRDNPPNFEHNAFYDVEELYYLCKNWQIIKEDINRKIRQTKQEQKERNEFIMNGFVV